MNRRKVGSKIRLLLAGGCFVMAVLSAFGVGTRDEPNGRLIFGLLWTAVGVLWVVRYWMLKDRTQSRDRTGGV